MVERLATTVTTYSSVDPGERGGNGGDAGGDGGGEGGEGETGGDGGAYGGGGPIKSRGVTPVVGKAPHSVGGKLFEASRHDRALWFQLSCRPPYFPSQ